MYRTPKFESLLQGLAEPTVILTPDLVVRHANSAFLAATSTSEFDLLDRHLINDVFPDKPGAAEPGRVMLRASFDLVVHAGRPDVAGISRYDLVPAGGGRPEPRYWSPVNTPIVDDDDDVRFIVHRVQDVTAGYALLSTLVATASSMTDETSKLGQDRLIRQATDLSAAPTCDGQLTEQIARLREALDARSIIEQAKGMLMASQRISAERAFELLRQESIHTNVKLRDVAAQHVLTHSARILHPQ